MRVDKIDICAGIFDYVNVILQDYNMTNQHANVVYNKPAFMKRDYTKYIERFHEHIGQINAIELDDIEYDEDDEILCWAIKYFRESKVNFIRLCEENIKFFSNQQELGKAAKRPKTQEELVALTAGIQGALSDTKLSLHCLEQCYKQMDKELREDYDPEEDPDRLNPRELEAEKQAILDGTYVPKTLDTDDMDDSRVDEDDYSDDLDDDIDPSDYDTELEDDDIDPEDYEDEEDE